MWQKRKVRSLNWFVKNCEINDSNDYIPNIDIKLFLSPTMQNFCGKEVTWNNEKMKLSNNKIYNIGKIKEDDESYYWEEWMFEPLEVEF